MDNQTNIQFEPQPNENNQIQVLTTTIIGGKEIAIYGTAEEPLFKATDVANLIEHSNVTVMLNTVDDDEKGVKDLLTPGGIQQVRVLTEDGFYEVMMQSRKEKAKVFKKGVKKTLHEIRIHGGYIANLPDFNNPAAAARAWAEQYERNEQLAAQNQQQTILIEQKNAELEERQKENELLKFYKEQFEKITGNNHTLYSLTDVAKFIGMRTVGEFIEWALERNILMRDRFKKSKRYVYHAKGDYAGDEKGYFKEVIPHTDSTYAVMQLKVTSLGVAKIRVVRERYLKRINKSYEEMMQQKENEGK